MSNEIGIIDKRGDISLLSKISSSTYALEKALDAAWTRNEVINNNISNADTPNFKKSVVKFEDYLLNAMGTDDIELNTTDSRHISINGNSLEPRIEKDMKDLQYRLDGNNVDIENEMTDLAKNSITYNTLAQKVTGEYKKIKYVISEGRR